MQRVLLPASFTETALYSFVASVVSTGGTPVADAFEFDFGRLWWIDGTGLTVFCNVLEWLRARNAAVRFVNYGQDTPALSYLDDSGFFQEYIGKPLRPNAKVRRSTLPFKPILPTESFSWLEHVATPWLASVLHVDQRALTSIKTSAKEIFNNISDHSGETIGFVHIQHHPMKREVHLTISDFGRGIPATIRSTFGPKSDADALRMAVEDGITARSRPNNRGAGLRILLDYVCDNKGSVVIHSLTARLRARAAVGTAPAIDVRTGAGTYPGTLVNIILPTTDFVGDPVEEAEAFEW
ncbi:MAG TPA: ATP-binding protein [Allosphingosinicella sp.]|nr:ATP-binding protein [Allosphingosinicella sp.]